jgi:glycosyltransferase involved in cell wall biosynthesis
MKKYRIGIDARFWRSGTGGIGRYSRELITHVVNYDKVNDYYIFLTEADMPEWNIKLPHVHPVVVGAKHYTVAEQTSFLRDLNAQNLDLVHFLNFNHPILYRRPYIATLQDLTVYYFPIGKSQKSALRRKAFIATLKHSMTGAKHVLPISENSARDAEKVFGIPREKMTVVYEGGPEPVKVTGAEEKALRKYLGFEEPYFLFVSQWRPHKGLTTLIEAFTAFRDKTKTPYKLILAGNQKVSYDEVMMAKANSPYKEDIITPGFVPEEHLAALYHCSTAYVLPSFYEGFGLMILEAFSYGTPAIVSNNSSLPEVGGEAALYFKTGDVGELAKRLEELAVNPKLRSELLAKGEKQLKKFSWAKCAKETHQAYMNILEEK